MISDNFINLLLCICGFLRYKVATTFTPQQLLESILALDQSKIKNLELFSSKNFLLLLCRVVPFPG